MTTQEDWAFRAAYLRQAAERLDARAEELLATAREYRLQARRCDEKANTPQKAKPGEMDEIERNATSLIRDLRGS